ncbi:MAG: hypothetical protein EKK37_00540 [Sphingobacteriales bacterium]|nr:MAG: hypothetical protein EKK37_00540 [Sphingobacteriales bacterium]
MEKNISSKSAALSKIVYTVFGLAAVVFVLLKDYPTAMIFGGIGLAFDPFDQSVPFGKRPVWQKAWLIIHLLLVLILLVFTIIKFK